jgi:hydroxymethylglutaryl-CoA lyase
MASTIDVRVQEVGTRDGLQSIPTIFPTDAKLDWIRAEAAAGVPEIEVASFVNPKLLPQMADAADVVAGSNKIEGLTVSTLVPNLRGAENGFAAGSQKLNFVMSVSEEHNMANVRRTVDQSLEEFSRIIEYRKERPEFAGVKVCGGMATSFGCTISGQVDPKDVMRVANELVERGADELAVADTVGYGNPAQVRALLTELYSNIGKDFPVTCHFHDTRGLGLANIVAALDAGCTRFDASLAGLGGCPYAPGASGNVVMDDLVFMLESMGLKTGVNLDRLMEARDIMESHLNGEPVHGAYNLAGAPKGFTPASMTAAE